MSCWSARFTRITRAATASSLRASAACAGSEPIGSMSICCTGPAIFHYLKPSKGSNASVQLAKFGVGAYRTDRDDLRRAPDGCSTNQVLYNLASRGIEFDLLPWQQGRDMPFMAYSPLGQGVSLLEHPVLAEIGVRHGVTGAQIALAWVIRQPGVIAIPKASSLEHVRQNVGAGAVVLDAKDCVSLDNAFPAPRSKQPLDIL